MSLLNGVVFSSDHRHHLDTLTSYIVARVFLKIAPWHISRQWYLNRCMWNGIRLTLALHIFPSKLRCYPNIDLEFFCCRIHLDCQSRDVNQSTENVGDSSQGCELNWVVIRTCAWSARILIFAPFGK